MSDAASTTPLLVADQVSREFPLSRGLLAGQRRSVSVLRRVDLTIYSGEAVGLVGESGSGKTTLSRLLLRLDQPTAGDVRFEGARLAEIAGEPLKNFHRAVQPVFQDPFAALNPRMRVGRIVSEPLRANGDYSRAQLDERVGLALERVGLRAVDAARYAQEFSGGQRQRIAIARALVSSPRLIVLDEPVASQDVSIRAQILNLLKELQQEHGMAYLYISHDLATVRFLCDRVYVLYQGEIVEHAPVARLFENPRHPYTRNLLSAWLPADPLRARAQTVDAVRVSDTLPSGAGCAFAPRCPHVTERCRSERPDLIPNHGSEVACHRADEIAL
ncbi:MAG: ATP-binding cassette domain-containing protein [Gammaproteobacteria bacterium]|nr:ATP-binding cassette domain-containing protein [Gammaproteobacteria bacterium]